MRSYQEGSLAPPAVAATEYDRDYYLHSCIGSEEWRESKGRDAAGIYAGCLRLAGMKPGWNVLDVGTGRAELVRVAIELGAQTAVGVDYSPDAVALAEETLRVAGRPAGARVALADARRLPVDDETFDLATMLDVVEHLTPEELHRSLLEVRRALRPGGRLFIHTAPNALVYEVTYKLQRHLRPGRSRRWPADPRHEFEHRMHVNEQTPGSLRRTLKEAGFDDLRVSVGRWIYTDFVPESRPKLLYHRLARVPWARRFGVIELFGSAARPAG